MSEPVIERVIERAQRVLLVGWDAADWQMATPMIEAGLMPTVAGLIARGASGNLATLKPALSPMLWTSIATGHTADVHGVLGFTEALPDRSGVRPVSSRTRRCGALWNILTRRGMRSNVVGWYATHPAEPIDGVMVSNLFEQPVGPAGEPWPVPIGAVHPESMASELASLRVHPGELDAEALAPFVPRLGEAAERFPARVHRLRCMLAQAVSVHAVATALVSRPGWDLTAVYYEAIDRFGHEFMHLHPPRMEMVDAAEQELFSQVMTGIYRFHDMMLQGLLEQAGEGTTVVLVSDHGYHSGPLRPDPREGRSGPVEWHRPLGVLAMAGPGVRPGQAVHGATLLDVTPTVLGLLGLPAGLDMCGRAWAEAMEWAPPERIFSWEHAGGVDGRLGADIAEDPAAAQAALQQLVELGYVDAPGEDAEREVLLAEAEGGLNLAITLMERRQFARALEVLDALPESHRADRSVVVQRAMCLLATGDAAGCGRLIATIEAAAPARAWMLRGLLAAHAGRLEEALAAFEHAVAEQPRSASLLSRLGSVLLGLSRPTEARLAFERAIEIDRDHPPAHHGLSVVALEMGQAAAAVDHALDAVSRMHFFPAGHFQLARALVAVGDDGHAFDALRVATAQLSGFVDAHELLAEVCERLGRHGEAKEHSARALRWRSEARLRAAERGDAERNS